MTIYSHSRLSAFEQCPLKYRFKYIDKLKPDIQQSIEGFLGNKVHEVLEWIYNEVRKGNEVELDSVIEKYSREWHSGFNPDIKIVKQGIEAKDYFNKGVRFLVDYFVTHSPFKDNTIATEKKVIIDLDDDGKYKMIGFIDRLVHNKDTNIFEIHDYKTSASMKSQEELDKDRQLALYSIGIKQFFNEVNDVHLIWHFLDFNKKVVSKRTDQELEELKQEIITLIDKIEITTEFSPCQSALCGWCEFRSYCPKC